MGGISKKGNVDTYKSQLSPLLALVDTPKLYRIKKIVRLENNLITLNNTIDVESTNSSNNEDNSAPLLGKDNSAKNNFIDYKNKGDVSNSNATFFKCIYVYISLIYLI